MDTFGYTGPAGLPIYLDNQANDPTVTYTLYDASSNVVFSVTGGADAGPYYLSASTNYTSWSLAAPMGSTVSGCLILRAARRAT